MEGAVARSPGQTPPNQALSMTAQKNSGGGAICTPSQRVPIVEAATESTETPQHTIVGGLRHQSRSDLGNTPASTEITQGPLCGERPAIRTLRTMYRPSVPSATC